MKLTTFSKNSLLSSCILVAWKRNIKLGIILYMLLNTIGRLLLIVMVLGQEGKQNAPLCWLLPHPQVFLTGISPFYGLCF